MSSSVFFKFKSQKEPTRLPFDGTAISVFDAKRDIIAIHKLGDGTDFDLAIYDEETNNEFVDDTVMIPRGTAIIARRLPPSKPGRGTAARYVTGKMPTTALNAGRIEKKAHHAHNMAPKSSATAASSGPAIPGLATEGMTEDERIAAMFQASSEQWNQTQEQMASARPVHHGQGGFKKGNAPAPQHPPPNGYVCYRCGEKGHWIQQCPTNTDPNFDGRPRVKRTTGIPKSFLKTVDKPVITDDDDGKPMSVMVNADGEYVIAEPDRASWEQYQLKAKAAGQSKEAASAEQKLLEEKGIACPLCNKLFKDAVKTPCCQKTYCDDCIQNSLVESDLICPNCDTKDVLLDRLVPDAEAREKVKDFLDNKKVLEDSKEKEKEGSKSPSVKTESIIVKKEAGTTPKLETLKPAGNPKKRAAEDDGNVMKRTNSTHSNDSASKRIKGNPLSPSQQQASLSSSKSPAMSSATPLTTNNNQNVQNTGAHLGFPQNGFANGMGFNNMNMNNGMDMSMGYNNMGMNNNMNMNMGMNAMGNYGNGMGMHMGNMGNNMGYNNNMGMNNMMAMNGMNGMNGGYGQNMGGYNNMGSGYNNNGMMNGGGYYNNNAGYAQQQQQQYNQYAMQGGMMNGMNQNQGQGFNNNNNMAQNMGSNIGNNMANNNAGGFQRKIFSEPFPTDEDSPYMRKPVNPYRHMRPKRARPSDFTAVGGGMAESM